MVFGLFLMSMTQQAGAAPEAWDLNKKVISGEAVQKVHAFVILYDATDSMNDTYKGRTKLKGEKDTVNQFNYMIPYLKMTASARAFGKFSLLKDPGSKLLFGPLAYAKADVRESIGRIRRGSGVSPMNAALEGAGQDLRSQAGQMAIIAFSDGEDMESYKPAEVAQRIKSDYGDRICIYTVQIGDSPAGKKLLEQVADASHCGFMTTAESISSPQAMADFVEKIFLEPRKAEPAKTAAPVVEQEVAKVKEAAAEVAPATQVAAPVAKPEPAPEKLTIVLKVQFDHDKTIIKKKYHHDIKQVADFMKQYPSTKATIEGYTDSVGTEAYNLELSQRRAESVKKYLIKNFGIDASRLSTIGYGLTKPVADNKTAEGKQQNRRVEAQLETVIKK